MHPSLQPFEAGLLGRPDGVQLYWEVSGKPLGQPALYLHGGPGGGLGAGGYRQRFDPSHYLIVGVDQRGCGRSRPWAIDDLDHLDSNNTQTLIEDLEALREHLGIGSWLLHGVSWGSTLALAYAMAHPDRVTGLVLVAVTTGSRQEIDWITEGVGAVFPKAWSAFTADVAAGERVVEHYARLLRHRDPAVREAAADRWDHWESIHVSLDPAWIPGAHRSEARDRQNFATLVTHYWAHDCFLTNAAEIIPHVAVLNGIPGVLIHGRRDISGPAITPWRLHANWNTSQLRIVEHEGHGGPDQMNLATQAISDLALPTE